MCPTEKLLKTTADEGRVEKSTGRCSPRGWSLRLQVAVRAEEARELVLLYRMKNRLYMVHDIQREVEYLKMLPEVDAKRLGFIGFSLSAKAALYVAAFEPEIKATVAVDPHLAIHGYTNYQDPWYLDWKHKFDSIQTKDGHQTTSPRTDPDWQQFFEQWLKKMPLDSTGY